VTDRSTQLLPGTLDMMVLKVVSVGPEHGFGIGRRLQEISRGVFDVNQGSLYPALQRLLREGWITAAWRQTDAGRRARYYRITRSGQRYLDSQRESYRRQITAVNRILAWSGEA
jgi:PadR family transcriptional regulator, regulatory protein PadR